MDSQGMAMIKFQGDKIKELTVSDPSRQLNRLSITVSGIYNEKREGLICISNAALKSTLMIVDVPQGVFAGKSVTLVF
jgi:chondroitin AC lyase